jgi:2-polyprenyl-6-methoxyphenol hydroxylase-like FAD-dependent oxidoreductase
LDIRTDELLALPAADKVAVGKTGRDTRAMNVDVAIAGGGPFGLMLAIELGRRGVSVALFDAKESTAFNPQANATQARTMEYFRRLGFVGEIRRLGLPSDYPTDIAYFTRYAAHELGRFRLPSSGKAKDMVASNTGSWSAAEAPHRVSQKFVEPVLLKYAKKAGDVDIRFNWELTAFEDKGDHVSCRFASTDGAKSELVKAQYLVGADGARSLVRRALGFSYTGEYGQRRNFMGGRMYAVYLRSPDFYSITGIEPAWMHWTFNEDRRAFMAAVDGKGEYAFHTQLREGEDENSITDEDAKALFQQACGAEIDCEILSHMGWTAGHALVADRFRAGRVFIGGDAAHLFTPTGGLGYNTAVEDAVNLGWKLAATLSGRAGPALLDSYEFERRKSATRNTGYARGFADSVGNYLPEPGLEEDNQAGGTLRRAAGAYLEDHARREFNIPGITFGTRYDGSPVLPEPDGPIPEDAANKYAQSGLPGGRAPHWWLPDGTSLFDLFGFDWTLLRLGGDAPSGEGLVKEAGARGLSLKVVDLPEPEIREIYGAPLVLVRPDQFVGWRGENAGSHHSLWDKMLGEC